MAIICSYHSIPAVITVAVQGYRAWPLSSCHCHSRRVKSRRTKRIEESSYECRHKESINHK